MLHRHGYYAGVHFKLHARTLGQSHVYSTHFVLSTCCRVYRCNKIAEFASSRTVAITLAILTAKEPTATCCHACCRYTYGRFNVLLGVATAII